MINAILAVASGGALGAVMRYGVNVGAVKVLGHGFPYATLIVNITGSFAMGILIALFAKYGHANEAVRLFLVTGFLGAFTTFSTFSLDFVSLLERHAYLHSALYLSGSVILSILGLFLAMALVKGITA